MRSGDVVGQSPVISWLTNSGLNDGADDVN